MSFTQKQEKAPNLVKALGLTQGQMEHLLLGYLCMQKPKVDWKKLGELSKVTPSSARTVFTKGRRTLEKWEERVIAGATKKVEEDGQVEEDNPDEGLEAAHVENSEN